MVRRRGEWRNTNQASNNTPIPQLKNKAWLKECGLQTWTDPRRRCTYILLTREWNGTGFASRLTSWRLFNFTGLLSHSLRPGNVLFWFYEQTSHGATQDDSICLFVVRGYDYNCQTIDQDLVRLRILHHRDGRVENNGISKEWFLRTGKSFSFSPQ